MRNGWQLATLVDVATWGSGGTPKSSDTSYYGGDIPWAVIGDLNDSVVTTCANSITLSGLRNSSAKLIDPGTILIAMYGSIGKLGIAGKRMATNQAIAFAHPRHNIIESKYLFWYLRSQRQDLLNAGKGATQQNISQTVLKSWPIPFPKLPEQKRIVEAIEGQFSRLDAAGAALRRALTNVRRFDASVFDQAAREMEKYGTLPLGDVAEVISGPAFTSKDFGDRGDGVRLLRGENIEPGSLRWAKTKTWPEALLGGYEHLFVSKGDIILAMDRPIVSAGLKLARVTPADLPALLVQRVARIRPETNIDSAFLFLVLRQSAFVRHVLADQTGTQLPHITLAGIRSFPIPALSIIQQKKFVAEIEQWTTAISNAASGIARASQRSAHLRQSVLWAAFNGQFVRESAL